MNPKTKNVGTDQHLINIIHEQLLPVFDNLMASDDMNSNKFYYINVKQVKIIDEHYIYLSLESQEIVTAIDEDNKRHSIIIILFDPDAQNYARKYTVDELQKNIDYVIAVFNSQQSATGNYAFISHIFPALNKYTEFNLQFKDILGQFVYNVMGAKIIQQFQASSYYKNHINEIETQVLKLRLFDPQLDLGEYPNNWNSQVSVKANLVDKNNQVIYSQEIKSGEIEFINYSCMEWFYRAYAYDYSPQHWNTVMEQFFASLVNSKLTFHSDDNIIKIQLLSYNNLSEKSQYLLSDDPAKIENVQRLLQLLQAHYLQNIVVDSKFDVENNLLTLTLNDIADHKAVNSQFIFGPNGIIQKDWKHYIYKPGINNLTDAKQTLQKILNLPYNPNYHKQVQNYQDVLQNEANLLVDAYNKRYSLNSLETMAQLSSLKMQHFK